ncbi:SMU1112c/YaeR family gloxylase I-like metalloprotein [Alteromonas sp. ASW11-130]|uniref:SMU1112c/YaeR family gloxylase I-like metalloprotein n=1 Tax=Alteromonas sp. ASW11-130 TaxID=3015775 RepID=UPI0022425CA2|nr:VOC family protein [Alteromonas sp. ASW11-130]MCW8090742.1 VOC family protein [Alteromonas sp. ASW11-130]
MESLITGVHHVAIICSNYRRSKHFYHEILGFQIVTENYRAERKSWKCDLLTPDGTQIELFSFPDPPSRPSEPEAQGLRHLAFSVPDIETMINYLAEYDVRCEHIRVDPYTQKRFTFFSDPDALPLELYELPL